MIFCNKILYDNQNKNSLEEIFLQISDKTNEIAYHAKKTNNQITMKPINNLLVYNSFKPVVKIFCSYDSVTLNICLTKSSIFTLLFEIIFVIFLDLISIIMRLFSNTEWLLALIIFHIIVGVLTICAKVSLLYFTRRIDDWFRNNYINIIIK